MDLNSRRTFLKAASATTVSTLIAPRLHLLALAEPQASPAKSDTVHLALIGAGGQGMSDTRFALQVPGVKLVAVADCYQGRLDRAKELWGPDVFTTRDYREVLARPDVDAVIVGTPDHWHMQVACDSMRAGKDVYCEKPMIHLYSDGPTMIETARKHARILQVGSQRVSSMVYLKAKELLAAGTIGKLNMVQAHWDRNTANGAWNYVIPPDATPETCDWTRFQGTAPKVPFSAERFFRWRKYKDYGTGVAGDLFVHLFSGTHFVTGAIGPTRAMANGGLRYWKDGRDVPDVLLALFDYPDQEFNLSLRVNFVNGGEEGEGFTFTGSEGTMEIGSTGVTINRVPRESDPGIASIGTFTEATQKQITAAYRTQYPIKHPEGSPPMGSERFTPPKGYFDSYDHFVNFFHSVRTRQQPVEDATFGYRAAGAALLANLSYEHDKIVHWDPKAMKLV